MKQRLFALAAAVVMALGLTACGGSGSSEGRTGDTMETYFFDFTVNSAYLTSDYAGHTPAEGNVLLVADITVKNTFQQSIEMYDTDFQVQWDDGDDAYAYPITTDMETYTEVDPVGRTSCPVHILWPWMRSGPASWSMRCPPVLRISPSPIWSSLWMTPGRRAPARPSSSTSLPRTRQAPPPDKNRKSATAPAVALLILISCCGTKGQRRGSVRGAGRFPHQTNVRK